MTRLSGIFGSKSNGSDGRPESAQPRHATARSGISRARATEIPPKGSMVLRGSPEGVSPRRRYLGPVNRQRFRDLYRILVPHISLRRHGTEEAEQLADRVAVIDRGRLIALDRPRALIDGIGGYAVDILDGGRTESRFFKNQGEAAV